MELISGLVLILHFIGLGSLLGGFITQMTEPIVRITRAMIDGAWTMMTTGVVLIYFAMQEAADKNEVFPHAKFGIKGLISNNEIAQGIFTIWVKNVHRTEFTQINLL